MTESNFEMDLKVNHIPGSAGVIDQNSTLELSLKAEVSTVIAVEKAIKKALYEEF